MAIFTLFNVNSVFQRPFDGLHILYYNNEEVLVAWYDRTVIISPLNDYSMYSIVTADGPVQNVFQFSSTIICYDDSGTIYMLKSVKSEEETDIFGSSADDDNENTNENIVLQKSFVRSIVIKNSVGINPARSGLFSLRYELRKIYIELYDTTCGLDSASKLFCVEVCSDSCICMGDVVWKVFESERFIPELREHLLKISTSRPADIIFLGLSSGKLYCLAVSAHNGNLLCKPWLLYSSAYPVLNVLCSLDSESKLFSKVCVFIDHGVIVVISFHNSNSLHYEVVHVPNTPQVMCEVGDVFICGDIHDLWYCTFNKNNSSIDTKHINIKGVYCIENLSAEHKILVATIHGTYYVLSLEEINENCKKLPSDNYDVSFITESLSDVLEQIEIYEKEILYENNFIAAFGIASQYAKFRQLVSHEVSVRSLNSMSLNNCLQDSSVCDGLNDVIMEQTSLNSLYCVDISLTNGSDIEFSSSIWSVLVSITTDGVTTQKVEKLACSFLSNSTITMSCCVCIEKPFLGVQLTVMLVRELSNYKSNVNRMPWLVIPVLTENFSVDVFLRSVCEVKSYNNTISEKLCDFLRRRNKKYGNFLKLDDIDSLRPSQNYKYELKLNREYDAKEMWSLILELCSLQSTDLTEKERSISSKNKFSIFAGSVRIEFYIQSPKIRIISPDPRVLFAIKMVIMRKWMDKCDSLVSYEFPSSTISRSCLYKEKYKIEEITQNNKELSHFKKAWRTFVTENLYF